MRPFLAPQTAAVCRRVLRKPFNARLFASSARLGDATTSSKPDSGKPPPKSEPAPLSSCPENTVLAGMNYLKGQEPVLAKKDEEYPSWLWDLLKPKVIPDDGPGGKGEKMRLRAANTQRIKEQNFLKTQ